MSITMGRRGNYITDEREMANYMRAEKQQYNSYWMTDDIAEDDKWGVYAWGGRNMTWICTANLPWFQKEFKWYTDHDLMRLSLEESYGGSGDGYIFIEAKLFDKHGKTNALAIKLYDWLSELDDYPYADGTGTHVEVDGQIYHDASELESDMNYDEARRVILEEYEFKGFINDDSPSKWMLLLMGWLGDCYPEEIDSRDGTGPYPDANRVLQGLFEVCPEALSDDYATNEMVIERVTPKSYWGNTVERPEYHVVPLALRGGTGRNWLHMEYTSQGELEAWDRCLRFIDNHEFVWTTGQNVTTED